MRSVLEHQFPALFDLVNRDDTPLVYLAKYREFGIQVLNGPLGTRGEAIDVIHFCPLTGRPLPSSLRNEWFNRLEVLGLEPEDSVLPEELQTEAWWVGAGN